MERTRRGGSEGEPAGGSGGVGMVGLSVNRLLVENNVHAEEGAAMLISPKWGFVNIFNSIFRMNATQSVQRAVPQGASLHTCSQLEAATLVSAISCCWMEHLSERLSPSSDDATTCSVKDGL